MKATKCKRDPVSDILREKLLSAPSIYSVAEATGLQKRSLGRFVRGERSLRLDLAARLFAHFGLEVRPRGRPRPRKGA